MALELIVLPIFGPLFQLPRLEDNTLDWAMRRFSNTTWIQIRPVPSVFTLLDVDNDTFRKWGKPLTPRGELQQLIEYAANAGARLIIVDFDLNRPFNDVGSEMSASDDKLSEYLSAYSDTASPVILVRRLNESSHDNQCPGPISSFLDAKLVEHGNIYWGTVRFPRDDDYIERRWNLWEPVCAATGKVVVLPSVQLTAASLVVGGQQKLQEMETWIQRRKPFDCNSCITYRGGILGWFVRQGKLNDNEQLNLGDVELEAAGPELLQRVLFRIPWLEERDSDTYVQIGVKPPNQPAGNPATSPEKILIRVPAWQITESKKGKAAELVKNRIAVIGASFRDSGDFHATPLGRMPGAAVLINSMYSLMEYGQLRERPRWAEVVMLLAGVFGVTWLFAAFPPFAGMIWSTAGMLAIAGAMSLYLFRQGRWLDFVVPLVIVQVHQFYEGYREYSHDSQNQAPEQSHVVDE